MKVETFRFLNRFFKCMPTKIRDKFYRMNGLVMGEHSAIAPDCIMDNPGQIEIGSNSRINSHCVFYTGTSKDSMITIGSNTWVGIGVKFICVTHKLGSHEQRASEDILYLPVQIGDGCWIGSSAVILPGVKIGNGVLIGAGAVVTSDCEDDYFYGGVPAKKIRKLETKDNLADRKESEVI